jgi:hypothetical protein
MRWPGPLSDALIFNQISLILISIYILNSVMGCAESTSEDKISGTNSIQQKVPSEKVVKVQTENQWGDFTP